MNRTIAILICGILCTSSLFATQLPKILVMTEMNPVTQSEHPMFKNGLDVIKQSGVDYQVSSMPWNRAYITAKATPNSVLFPIYKTPNRVDSFYWICPIAAARNMYLFRLTKRKDLHLTRFEDTKGKVIGVVKDSMLHQYIVKNYQGNNFSLDSTVYDSTNIDKLLNGRLDYVAQSEEQLTEHFARNNLPFDLVTKELLIYDHTQYPMCLAIAKGTDKRLLSKIKHAYQQLFSTTDFSPVPLEQGVKDCH